MCGALILSTSQGAHHLDLMFANKDDPPSVVKVRQRERAWIKTWIQQAQRYKPSAALGDEQQQMPHAGGDDDGYRRSGPFTLVSGRGWLSGILDWFISS